MEHKHYMILNYKKANYSNTYAIIQKKVVILFSASNLIRNQKYNIKFIVYLKKKIIVLLSKLQKHKQKAQLLLFQCHYCLIFEILYIKLCRN